MDWPKEKDAVFNKIHCPSSGIFKEEDSMGKELSVSQKEHKSTKDNFYKARPTGKGN